MANSKDEALKLALELLAVSTFHTPKLQAQRTEVINILLANLAEPVQDEAWMAQQKANVDHAIKCATEAMNEPNGPMEAVRRFNGSSIKPEPVGEWIEGRSEPKRIAWKPGYVASAQVGDRLFDAPAPGIDYKALFEQMCERCDDLDKALGEYERAQPAVPLTPAKVNAMAEAHGIDGDARHWFVVGITDCESSHGIK